MKRTLFFCAWVLLTTACNQSTSDRNIGRVQYNAYCGSCHLAPNPANIPKSIWKDEILPDMASRLGYEFLPLGADSFSFHDRSVFNPKLSETIIDSVTWNLIYGYVMTLAPDVIPEDTLRENKSQLLNRFSSSSIALRKGVAKSMITSIQFNKKNHRFLVGDAYSQLIYQWPFVLDSVFKINDEALRFASPLTSVVMEDDLTLITESGYLFPNNQPIGALHCISQSTTKTVASNLFRPVFTKVADLNKDHVKEILVCEFGNRTGQLSILRKSGEDYEKSSLLSVPGTTKVEIADMNADGLEDIVVLASQGNEGIYILYNEGDLKFREDQVIELPPEYGSSWFQLVDYNKDGHWDIVLTNGDNGDFSVFAKPYHGVRLFINDGLNTFAQKWFYPIYGATRVLAEDYDLDGDLDFAVMSFFPDYTAAPEEGFVYLENNGPKQYDFAAYTFPQSLSGRWLVMDHGDFDLDGDVDIMLGSYTLPINKKHDSIMESWKVSGVNLLLLKNNTIK